MRRGRVPWNTRHQVSESCDNRQLPQLQRVYFDDLPHTRCQGGGYFAVPGHRPRNFERFRRAAPEEQHRQLLRRFERYPFQEAIKQASISRASLDPQDEPGEGSPREAELDAERLGIQHMPEMPVADESVVHCSVAEKAWRRLRAANVLLHVKSHTAKKPRPQRRPPKGPIQEFHAWCLAKFGSPTRLWRCLDSHNNMRVGRDQFFRCLQDMGYSGDARELFRLLNKDQTGTLLFYHFSPITALAVAELLLWARGNGGLLEGRLTRSQFLQQLKRRGFRNEEALVAAFELIDDGSGTVMKHSSSILEKWDFPEWLVAEPNPEAAELCKSSLLTRCHENAFLAWRSLDRASAMRVSWHEFRAGCRRLLNDEVCQSLPGAWRALDDDLSGWLTMKEFDEAMHQRLCGFAVWWSEQGSAAAVFPRLHDGRIGYHEFRHACRPSGVGDAVLSEIFHGLDCNQGGDVSLNELRFLDQLRTHEHAQEVACHTHHNTH